MKRERQGRVSLSVDALESGLSPQAQRSLASRGRVCPEAPYQRDRDRIVHSKAFRRLKHKTQVFISPEGDHYRTRLTHTLEVSGIARTVARALRLNEDLTEAIALGHDLGHTPFGHAGESALDGMMRDLRAPPFRHNEQSLRVVDELENDGEGLNLTWEVRDGILHHTGSGRPATLEGEVVRICDRVAYINHDIDDALRAGLIEARDLPAEPVALLGITSSERIDALVHDLVDTSHDAAAVEQSEEVGQAMDALRTFLFQTVYTRSLHESEGPTIAQLLTALFQHYVEHPDQLPPGALGAESCDPVRAVTDHIAGMTDRYAQRVYFDVFVPRSWGRGL
jgi:dGTPase